MPDHMQNYLSAIRIVRHSYDPQFMMILGLALQDHFTELSNR